jgi:hypothetical protein
VSYESAELAGEEFEGGIKLDEPEISNGFGRRVGGGGVHLVHFLQPDRTESVTGSDMRISPPLSFS